MRNILLLFLLTVVSLVISPKASALNPGAVDFQKAEKATPAEAWIQANDGWWPHISPDGKYVVYGNGGSYVTNLKTKETHDITNQGDGASCRTGQWFNDDNIVTTCYGKNGLEVWIVTTGTWKGGKIADIRVENKDPVELTVTDYDLPTDGHWLATTIEGLYEDGQFVDSDLGHPVIAGDLLYATCDRGSNLGPICIYRDGQFLDSFEIQGLVGEMNALGEYVAWGGYNGGTWGRTSKGGMINLGVWGGQFEDGGPKIFSVDGKIWLATFNGFSSCALRPWGQTKVILVKDCPAASWDVAYDGQNIIVAAASDKGQLHINKISKDSVRVNLCGESCTDLPDSEVPRSDLLPSQNTRSFSSNPSIKAPTDGIPTDLGGLIQQIFTWSLSILGISVFVMFFYSGFLWLTAAGNTAKIGEARTHMTNAIFGAILLLSAYLILYTINPDFVKNTVNLPGLESQKTK
ncbi:MAG: hypothetical protein A2915_01480 [Candidatus Yanofskybacteria bacterium RIFCSPLOWO2_01_FULL_41_34]|uniref:Uncharacterized protein n=1 Tax=Candidatus Yanofskybacteria bacterium RIFCSPHIGHO2_01_FULL_41_26 TaxID=1802661 RepID=A0A1F8ED62_9BACT|nr:MAG: hypothetical protein A2649_02245 [Candidatus Yanofskybacteria bacterium RIFCSPHIGHO2_01_FULL_41_26]OGN21901.1 MAG: hypothetical protein A2915_01480 [Candidatus Yanofskybacteria bacterium RIFCSPLOWO2_01_FULL_41_34]